MSGRPVTTDFNSWMRATERRMSQQERRPANTGNPAGLTAMETSDWNAVFETGGFYFSRIGAVNSPDGAKAWMGTSMVDADGAGFQRITSYRDPASEGDAAYFPSWPGPTYSRAFFVDSTIRSWSNWVAE